MSVLTEIRPEVQRYIPSWVHQPKFKVVPEIASVHQEAKEKVDVYDFVLDTDGDLFSLTHHCKIKSAMNVNTSMGQIEVVVVNDLSNWYVNNSEGVAVWVSPQDDEFYPDDSKIVVSEILNEDGKKILRNRAFIRKYDQKKALEVAQALSERSLNRPLLDSVKSVRSTPLMLSAQGWVDIMSEVIDDPDLWETIKSGQDLIEQEKVLKESDIVYDQLFRNTEDKSVDTKEFFEGGNLSCPSMSGLTPFEAFSGGSRSKEGCSKIACRRCPWVANENEVRKIQEGILKSCPDCGWSP